MGTKETGSGTSIFSKDGAVGSAFTAQGALGGTAQAIGKYPILRMCRSCLAAYSLTIGDGMRLGTCFLNLFLLKALRHTS